MAKERVVGIELCRAISILFVVTVHVLGQGGVLAGTDPGSINYKIVWWMEIFAYCGVNCFALISGYVGWASKFTYDKILALWVQVVFYSLGITLMLYLFVPQSVGYTDVLKSALPVITEKYWYFTAYFCMSFFIPFLQHTIASLEKAKLERLIVTIVILLSILPTVANKDIFKTSMGYSAIWLGALYIIGGHMQKYDIKKSHSKKSMAVLYVAMIMITWISKMLISNTSLLKYTSPTILIAALALLLFFSKLEIKHFKKSIGMVAAASFGVYLIHAHPFLFKQFLEGRFASYGSLSSITMIAYVVAAIGALYLMCTIIDILRGYLFRALKIKEICQKILRKNKDLIS